MITKIQPVDGGQLRSLLRRARSATSRRWPINLCYKKTPYGLLRPSKKGRGRVR